MLRSRHTLLVAAAVALLMSSALVLIALRGQALMLDLSALAGMLCL